MSKIHLIPVLFLAFPGVAQVRVDKSLHLLGEGAERRVSGLAPATEPEQAIDAGTLQHGGSLFAEPTAGNAWAVQLPALGDTPVAGSLIVLRVPEGQTGPINVQVNAAPSLPLFRGGEPVDAADLAPGGLLSVIHTGTTYQVINGSSDVLRTCPPGMVAVNEQFCIETVERTPSDFFEAAVTCASSGRRLCSWAEFYTACTRELALGLATMTNNWEWTNNTSNEDNSARIVGLNGCITAANWMSTGSSDIAHRCCYTR